MNKERQNIHMLRKYASVICVAIMLTFCAILLQGKTTKAETDYPYLIKVNKKMCTVTVYERNSKGKYTVPVKAMLCSPGADTPLGTYKTPNKYRWHTLMDDVYGQYCTRITGGILFHSVWYYEMDPATLSNAQFNKLGTMCSHGCVRLNVADAKWIYDNCPLGTTVVIYNSSKAGPLGKPAGIKVSTSSTMGYDPTDRWSPGNPYIKLLPVIKGMKDKTITYGKKVNVKSGVKAYASTGTSLTSKMKITIRYGTKGGTKVKKVNSKKTGKYYITYSVTDALNKTTEETVVYTVVDNTLPKLKKVKNKYTNGYDSDGNKVTNSEVAKKGVKATWHGKSVTDDMKVKIKRLKKVAGLIKYRVTYSITTANGKTVKQTAYLYKDTKAPELTGVSDKEISADDLVDGKLTSEYVLEEVSAADNVTTSENVTKIAKIYTKIYAYEAAKHGYKVRYRVSDKAGNWTTKYTYFTIKDDLTITGTKDVTLEAGTDVTKYDLMQNVKATIGNSDITSSVKTELSQPVTDEKGNTVYTVTYTVEAYGYVETVTSTITVSAASNEEPVNPTDPAAPSVPSDPTASTEATAPSGTPEPTTSTDSVK